MAANMYRVGDCVYFETSSTSPYQIRRIEELNKTASGNVEAKVMCFYRRRDLPNPLIQLADKHQLAQSAEDSPVAMKLKKICLKTPVGEEQATQAVLDPAIVAMEEESSDLPGTDGLAPKQRHQAKHRELFLSRQVETLPATHIRGKCSVTLLNETESLLSYLNKDDAFFYCLVFDPSQKTLLADKGEIRVGSRFQTEVTNLLKEGEEEPRSAPLETLVWTPAHGLSDRQIDQFLVVSRSVGTFARALDCSSSVKQPSLHMSAAAASRDITLFHAMDTLHKSGYSIEAALAALVPASGPVLCRDEMEEWSASEANLFEEALDKYGKDFADIRQDFLPWKTLKNLVEYYYMWKTTDRYVQQKRVKAVEAESKLKQVYIPNYNKPSPALIATGASKPGAVLNGGTNGTPAVANNALCASCQATSSNQWYSWGPQHLQYRLCGTCWQYWKKYGGLKVSNKTAGVFSESELEVTKTREGDEGALSASHRPHRCTVLNCAKEFKLRAHLARHVATAHGAGEGARPVMKTRAAFYLRATPFTRLARRLARALRPRRHARAPFAPVNLLQVKHECSVAMAGLSAAEIRAGGQAGGLAGGAARARGAVAGVAARLAQAHGAPAPRGDDWLVLTPRDRLPQPRHQAFPKPPKAPDGSLMYERVLNRAEIEARRLAELPAPLKRRAYDENGLDRGGAGRDAGAPPAKRPNKHPAPMHRVSREQYAALCARAHAAGQPLPKHAFPHVNGKPTHPGGRGRRHVISWMDAPDDLYFRATIQAKVARRTLSGNEVRRGARAPWRPLRGPGGVAGGASAPGPAKAAPPAPPAPPPQLVILD